ncbi:pirin family protein [Photobacterium sp.]|uniref:pirin family protein n=1 Tax=Photobacterium sp. TaxID=660 RepID=UPI00299DD443|nr:pirin family protein [Photobacterium sp.]MDX1300962.1 pirin family protein [Photobacterium sp.]
MKNTRKIIKIRYGLKTGSMTAFINRDNISEIDPFVLWDHFDAKGAVQPVGLDYHGHSGVDTVSYPVAGNLKHIDSSGCQTTLQGGDIHVMTTGGGIIHKDIITPHNGNAETFQLWTALPANEGEMDDASSANYTTSRLPLVEEADSTTKVLVGSYKGAQSPVSYSIQITYLDIIITPYGVWHYQPDKSQTSGFIYLRSGIAYINGNQLHPCQMGILETSSRPVQIKTGNTSTRLFVVLGKPLNQPLISSGASVHSSKENLVIGKNKIEELMGAIKNCR